MILIISILLLYSLFIIKQVIGVSGATHLINIPREPETTFSVIVPFRNEEHRISNLIESINLLNYPTHLFEIVFVDDHSNDNTSLLIKKNLTKSFKIIETLPTTHGKKAAIKWGAQHAQNSWLVFTDADCILSPQHLTLINNSVLNNLPDYIAGTVSICKSNSIISFFEEYENIILQGFTAAGFNFKNPTLANGANWAVKKELFLAHAYQKKEGPSGDDVFFLHQIKSNKDLRICYLTYLNVATFHSKNIKEFLFQKIRWASKSFKYFDKSTIWQGLVVGLGQIAFIGGIILLLITKKISILAIPVLLLKLLTDWIFYIFSARMAKKSPDWTNMILNSIVYPFYSVAIAILSPLIRFNWKGRKY